MAQTPEGKKQRFGEGIGQSPVSPQFPRDVSNDDIGTPGLASPQVHPVLFSAFAGFAPDSAFTVTPSGSAAQSYVGTPLRKSGGSGFGSGIVTPGGGPGAGSTPIRINQSAFSIPSSLPSAAPKQLGLGGSKLSVIASEGDLQALVQALDELPSEPLLPYESTQEQIEEPTANRAAIIYGGLILVAFIMVRSALTILLQQCNTGNGYPFVLQTVMIGPFFMQIVAYTVQTCSHLGTKEGLRALTSQWRYMGPAVFFSIMVSLSMLLQTLSLNYIDASTYIVLLQLVLCFVAVGERFVLGQKSTLAIWCLISLQVLCVSYYQVSSLSSKKGGKDADTSRYFLGMGICIVACLCSALGTIMQQRFLQTANTSVAILPSVKLCYQHVIGFFLMLVALAGQPSQVDSILKNGFFHGWTTTTVLASASMWLSFFTASSVTAYVSAMAGAMGSAVVVIVVGIIGSIMKGKAMPASQIAIIVAIACITASYTLLKFRMLAAKAEAAAAQDMLKEPLLDGED